MKSVRYCCLSFKMFADDTKEQRELSNITRDGEALQLDVDRLLSWASTWQRRFNPDKCEVLRVTHKRDLSIPTYSLCTSIKSVKSVKDLGITISSDLSWSEHVNVTININCATRKTATCKALLH